MSIAGLRTDTVARPSTRTFETLDGLRGVAAIVVVVWHASALFGFGPASGYLAVDLFFCLSGFVLAHAYDARIAAGLSPLRFMRLRLIRLYPLYLLSLLIFVAASTAALLIGASTNWTPARLAATFALNALFVPAVGGPVGVDDLFPLNVPAWSLWLELIVNAAFVVLWQTLSSRRNLVILIAVAAAGLVVLAARHGSLNLGAQWRSLTGGVARVIFSFFVGVLLRRWMTTVRRVPLAPTPLLPLALLFAVLWLPVASSWRPAFDLIAIVAVFPIIVVLAAAREPGVVLARTFAVLGRASYAVYVLHVPLLAIAIGVLPRVCRRSCPRAVRLRIRRRRTHAAPQVGSGKPVLA